MVLFLIGFLTQTFAVEPLKLGVLGDMWAMNNSETSPGFVENLQKILLKKKLSQKFIIGKNYSSNSLLTHDLLEDMYHDESSFNQMDGFIIEMGMSDIITAFILNGSDSEKVRILLEKLKVNLQTLIDVLIQNEKYVFFAKIEPFETLHRQFISRVGTENISLIGQIYDELCYENVNPRYFECIGDFMTDLQDFDFAPNGLLLSKSGNRKIAKTISEHLEKFSSDNDILLKRPLVPNQINTINNISH